MLIEVASDRVDDGVHPAALPEIAIKLFWHAKVHKDPANQWLRGLVFETFAD
jgi:hypothetical protein